MEVTTKNPDIKNINDENPFLISSKDKNGIDDIIITVCLKRLFKK